MLNYCNVLHNNTQQKFYGFLFRRRTKKGRGRRLRGSAAAGAGRKIYSTPRKYGSKDDVSVREEQGRHLKACRGTPKMFDAVLRTLRRWICCRIFLECYKCPGPFWTGTGAIRQECLMHSRLSAPQAPDLWSGVCPGQNGPGTLRFSRPAPDARRTTQPPAPAFFLALLFPGRG